MAARAATAFNLALEIRQTLAKLIHLALEAYNRRVIAAPLIVSLPQTGDVLSLLG
jgi:hypothetical protein